MTDTKQGIHCIGAKSDHALHACDDVSSIQASALQMIFVIDDDHGVREGTASLLRSLGYEVLTFDSGRSFLEANELSENVSCAIIDIVMPDIDGFELHCRLVSGGHRFPVIFLTALTDAATRARMSECEVHRVLTKPCSERSLVDCVESALAEAGIASERAAR